MKKGLGKKIWVLVAIVSVLLVMAVGGIFYYFLFYPQFRSSEPIYVYVDRDDTADSIYNKVLMQGKAANMSGFRLLSTYRKLEKHIHTGRYVIRPGDNVYQVFSRFYRGSQAPVNVTIGHVRTLGQLAHNVGKQLMIDSTEIAERLNNSDFHREIGLTPETVICLFVPDTYQFYWNVSVDDFLARMQKEHQKYWNDDRRAKATSMAMTPEEICTLASIVDEETNNSEEKPTVAGLYINRLHQNMLLQADPTVKFALQNFTLRRILDEHLAVDSPYNTYKYKGLPPGPIRIASKRGIESVLDYVKHDYIYMCAKEDFSGTHRFAATYDEHIKNAQKYRQALNARNIFR